MAKRLIIAAIVGLGLGTPTIAVPGTPTDIEQFLAKRFKPNRGLFGAIASAIPVKTDPASIAGMEGARPDGSYWTSAFFNTGNVVTFGYPRGALAKFCAQSGGQLQRVQAFDLLTRHQFAFGATQLTDAQGSFNLPHEIVGTWITAPSDGGFAMVAATYGPFDSDRTAQIDAKGVLGVFACQSADVARWHVAILPTMAGAWRQLGSPGVVSGDAAVMLSVRVVDRASIARAQAAIDARRREDAKRTAALNDSNAENRAAAEARVARGLPRLRAYQAGIKVGDETSCGLVLDVRGTLVEVQVPPEVALENGATRLFVKRTKLTPPRSPLSCYSYSPFERVWRLSGDPEAQLAQ